MRKYIIAFLCLAALTACATNQKMADSWIGNSESALVNRWGPPDQVIEMSADYKVYVYDKPYIAGSPIGYATVSQGTKGRQYMQYTPAQSYRVHRIFKFKINRNTGLVQKTWYEEKI